MSTKTYQVVVYGADLPGIFAAAKAAGELSSTKANPKVALIVPYPKTRYKDVFTGQWKEDFLLGGIMTAGGLNYWDDASHNGQPVQRGSYGFYKGALGLGFNRLALASQCAKSMDNSNGVYVEVYYGSDIYSHTVSNPPYTLRSVNIVPVQRNSNGYIIWGSTANQITLNATVFIDASVEGRLARTVNTACITGRYDWPLAYLKENDERNATNFVGRQQAATLMFKMKGISSSGNAFGVSSYTPYSQQNGAIMNFNKAHQNTDRIMIKPPNAAKDGNGNEEWPGHSAPPESDEWWVNALLIFDVDGRSNYRDEVANTPYNVARSYGYMSTDEAWVKAKNFIKTYKTQIEHALRTFSEFSGASIVLDDRGDPIVGDLLYIRESVHMAKSSTGRAHNSEENYHLTASETKNASGSNPPSSSSSGYDYANYANRIGLAKYWCDIHPYQPEDLINGNGDYLWFTDDYLYIRPDAVTSPNPVYLPYDMIKTSYVANLLIPGYGTGVCSYSWGEVRVFSSLSVLGDAAGVAAAYCCQRNVYPYQFQDNPKNITDLQNRLRALSARLEK